MLYPAFLAACSTAAHPPRTIRSASETFFPPDCERLKSCWIFSSACSSLRQFGRVVHFPVLLWREADPRPVGAPALVGAAEARRRCPGGGDQLGYGQSRCEELALEGSDVLLPDQFMIDRGDGVLPQLRRRNPRAEVARDGTHVAVQQLVPRLGERFCKLIRMLVEALRDRRVDRIHLQRKVRREHHGGCRFDRS